MDNQTLTKKEAVLGLCLGVLFVGLLGWCQLREDTGTDRVTFTDIKDDVRWFVPDAARPTVERAAQHFFDFCHVPLHQLDDLYDFQIELVGDGHPDSYWVRNYGWTDRVVFSMRVESTVSNQAGGHRLQYEMGGGHAPGVGAHKAQAATYCIHLGSAGGGRTLFTSVPEMKVLDQLH